MQKDFLPWHLKKADLNEKRTNVFFREGDIWFCSLGLNVGSEEDGKHELFLRPIVIFRKFSADIFWGIPLTSSIKEGSYYYRFDFMGRAQSAMLTQARLLDRKRLLRKVGVMPRKSFRVMKEKFMRLVV